ncbi:endoplasmic reticulum metallopeptidase 1-like isoform X2 [Tachypleus tridentatus]|uniref:endoplasmic reticulum metallopeptidase 1-like isoform X2 n=1 Tax=Tachypleus tridentatus TaxID=6853 RepID=UPI003FD57E03
MDSMERLRFRSRGSSAAVRSRSQILTDYEDDKKYSEVLLDKYLFMFLGAFYTFILFVIILCEGYLPSPRSIGDVAGTTSSRSKQYKLFTGASDDSVNCATMLEILMVLSNQNRSLPHNIVFLFNGAEENILQGSHGFITQHRWAKEIQAFINLESCGAGGRDMLFQAGPEHPWIVQAYTEGAKFPFGSIVAQEVFQSGVVPADTDFRIFTEFGGIPGLDFAYVRNGYVYHTKYDRPEFINEGSIQRTGENMLGLIHNILKSPHFNHPLEYRSSKLVFFDVLGLFMITYSASLGTIMNESIAILTVLEIFLKIRLRMDKIYTTVIQEASRLLIAISITLSSAVLALCVNLAIAAVLGAVGYSMTWYNRPYWILGVYFFPALSCLILVHWFVTLQRRQAKGSDWEAEDLYYDAVRVIWAVIICLMTRFDIHSAYLPTVLLLFTTAIRSLGGRLCISTKTKGARLKLIIIHLSSQAIPLVIILYNCWQVFLVFVPIMGRTGAQVNPDLIIGAVTAIIAYICTSYMLTLVHVARYVLQAVGVLFLLFITCLCIVCLSPLGFPYSEDANSPAPQKYIIAHVERNFHSKSGELLLSDGGFWIVPLDHNGPYSLFPFVPELQNAELVECVSHPYCGMPYYLPFVSKLKKSYYLKGSKPKIHTPFKLELVEMQTLNPELRKLKFRVTGPTHMAIILCPVEKVILLRWSLTYSLPHPGVVTWNERPVYFIYYSDGEATTPWEFWVDLEVPSDFTSDQPIVDLTFNTHYLHGSDMIGEDLQELLEKMPPWTHVTAWTSTLQSYIF